MSTRPWSSHEQSRAASRALPQSTSAIAAPTAASTALIAALKRAEAETIQTKAQTSLQLVPASNGQLALRSTQHLTNSLTAEPPTPNTQRRQRETTLARLLPSSNELAQQSLAATTASTSASTRVVPARRVIEEDEYIGTMTQIIQRDFYPALHQMNQQLRQNTSSARDDQRSSHRSSHRTSNGKRKRSSADAESSRTRRRSSSTSRHRRPREWDETPMSNAAAGGNSSAVGDATLHDDQTPLRHRNADASVALSSSQFNASDTDAIQPAEAAAAEAAVPSIHPHDMRLSQYLATHTSSDNADYSALAQRQFEHKRQHQLEWIYQQHEQSQQQLALDQSHDQTGDSHVKGWTHKPMNAVMFHPIGIGEDVPRATASQLRLQASNGAAAASALTQSHDAGASASLLNRTKSIQYEATRLPGTLHETSMQSLALRQHQGSQLDTPVSVRAAATPQFASSMSSAAGTNQDLQSMPPLEAATPRVKLEQDAQGFSIPATPQRDELLWRLDQSRATKLKRKEAQQLKQTQRDAQLSGVSPSSASGIRTPGSARSNASSYSSSAERRALLSPAARKLYNRLSKQQQTISNANSRIANSVATPLRR